MQSPVVSVVIPMYNASRYIEVTINSVLIQSYTDFEVIVIDDGSSDSGPEIVQKLIERDPRIRIEFNPENSGVCASRNNGYASARGRYIMFLDADDLIAPLSLEKLCQTLEQSDHSVAMAYGAIVHMDESGVVQFEPSIPGQRDNTITGWLQFNGVGSGSGALIKRDCLEQAGLFNESMRQAEGEGCADWLFYIGIRRHFDVVYLPYPMVGYRVLGESMSSNPAHMLRALRSMYDRVRPNFPELTREVENEGAIWAGMYFLGRGVINRNLGEIVSVCITLNPLHTVQATCRLYTLRWSALYWRKIRRRWRLSRRKIPRWQPVEFNAYCEDFNLGKSR